LEGLLHAALLKCWEAKRLVNVARLHWALLLAVAGHCHQPGQPRCCRRHHLEGKGIFAMCFDHVCCSRALCTVCVPCKPSSLCWHVHHSKSAAIVALEDAYVLLRVVLFALPRGGLCPPTLDVHCSIELARKG
jgi:hypothetical protein